MELQQFGQVETAKGTANAMLCIDKDRPDELLIQLWGVEHELAIRFKGALREGAPVQLETNALFRVNDNGGLWLPALADEERAKLNGLQVTLTAGAGALTGQWTVKSGETGKIYFPKPDPVIKIDAVPCSTWDDFKNWANTVREQNDAVAFRGHGDSEFRLRTTFHRAGRTRLERYCAETLPEFRGHAEAIIGTRFDLNNGDDYSVVLGLAQHHGLPTPLLDWTGSPYIAAFFAFADAMEAAELRPKATHVRIYALTRDFISTNFSQTVVLPYKSPYIAPLTITPRHNPRLYAQQGQFLVTNVADVESFICKTEKIHHKTYLVAADVPIACGSKALEDLAFMGLTAGTMFPGLDGVCRMMRHAMAFKRIHMPPPGTPSSSITTEASPREE